MSPHQFAVHLRLDVASEHEECLLHVDAVLRARLRKLDAVFHRQLVRVCARRGERTGLMGGRRTGG